ncbi:MAG: hypothetical protein Q8R44_19905 [Novosphingobium sp.]|nr:hypothetical protein [Novosphingobium sp.]
MTLKYYHAEPAANSIESMIPLIEKGLEWESVYVYLHMMVERMFPELEVAANFPHVVAWREAMNARPAAQAALAGEDRTAPGLRTFTGHVR